MTTALNHSVSASWPHRVRFTRGAFSTENPVLAEALTTDENAAAGRVLAVLDDRLPSARAACEAYFAAHRATLPALAGIVTLPGGEACKDGMRHIEPLLAEMNSLGLCRKSTVLAIGGGAVLDAAGFAAALCHRGIPLVRMPTTVLAQCDSGVGVKNAVNLLGKKNFIGTFAIPKAVVNDFDFLDTLSDRDFRSGLSEVVKVALLKDAAFFARLEAQAPRLFARDRALCEESVIASARLHLEHIALGGDPFETRAARPLDFGHWSAHKLEQLTGYALPHGEAVSIGMALDMTYAGLAGHCTPETAARTRALLTALGLPLWNDALADAHLLDGLKEFREHLGGELTLTLASAPGAAVNLHAVDIGKMKEAIGVLRGI